MMQSVKLTDNLNGIRCNGRHQVMLIRVFASKAANIAGPDEDERGCSALRNVASAARS